VEVGANDPILLSQTRDLERRGWNGILIEPLQEYAEQLPDRCRMRMPT
jgi:hypothetical protein